ncbi:MAG: transporter [Pirellulales bacterium]
MAIARWTRRGCPDRLLPLATFHPATLMAGRQLFRRRGCRMVAVVTSLVMVFAVSAVAFADANSPPSQSTTRRDVWRESLIGPLETERWTPLSIDEFFTDGWDRPYDSVDHTSPRQTWINSADGAFYRLAVISGAWAQDTPSAVESANGSFFLFTPLNRRFEIGWFLPFTVISPDPQSPATAATRGTGDLTVAPRFLLAEDKTYSLTANCYVRCPTGSVETGNGVASLSPDLEFWTNPTGRWVLRGGVGVTVPTNLTAASIPPLEANPWSGFNLTPGPFTSFDGRLAGGYYLTPADAPVLKHLCATLATNFHTSLSGGSATYFSITPGMRTGIGRDWYLLAGLEVPLVGPLPFSNQAIAQAIKNF